MKVCLLCTNKIPKRDNKLYKYVHRKCIQDLEKKEYLPLLQESNLYKFSNNRMFEKFMEKTINANEFLKSIIQNSNKEYGLQRIFNN